MVTKWRLLQSLQNQTFSTLKHLWFQKHSSIQKAMSTSASRRSGRKTECVRKKPSLKNVFQKAKLVFMEIRKRNYHWQTKNRSLSPGDSIKLQLRRKQIHELRVVHSQTLSGHRRTRRRPALIILRPMSTASTAGVPKLRKWPLSKNSSKNI